MFPQEIVDECGVCGGTGTSCALAIEMSVEVTQLNEAQTDVSYTKALIYQLLTAPWKYR